MYTDDGPGADFKGTVSLSGSSCRVSLSKINSKGPQFAFETTDAHGTSTSWAARAYISTRKRRRFSREGRRDWIGALASRGVALKGDYLLDEGLTPPEAPGSGGEEDAEEEHVSPSRRPSRELEKPGEATPKGGDPRSPQHGSRSPGPHPPRELQRAHSRLSSRVRSAPPDAVVPVLRRRDHSA